MGDPDCGRKAVLSLDIGTTKVRALVFARDGRVLGQAHDGVRLIYPRPGWVEMESGPLWESVKKVLREAIVASGVSPGDLGCMGISTQRATFVTWDRDTGKEFHNFITWKDVRSEKLCRVWNNSWSMRVMPMEINRPYNLCRIARLLQSVRAGSAFLHFLTRQKRFKIGSIVNLQNKMVNMRLLWALQNYPELSKAASEGRARFGTVDTWLLHKMSGGRLHITEIGNVSATGKRCHSRCTSTLHFISIP